MCYMSAPTALLKGQYLPLFWLKKKNSAGHFMPDFTEWLCLVGMLDNLLRKDRAKECQFLIPSQA